MQEKILNYVKKTNELVNLHDISAAIHEPELAVLEELEKMNDVLEKKIVPLGTKTNCSIYFMPKEP